MHEQQGSCIQVVRHILILWLQLLTATITCFSNRFDPSGHGNPKEIGFCQSVVVIFQIHQYKYNTFSVIKDFFLKCFICYSFNDTQNTFNMSDSHKCISRGHRMDML